MWFTIPYYKYCEYAKLSQPSTESFMSPGNSENFWKYKIVCQELHTDYSSHTLLKHVVNKFYEFLGSQDDLDAKEIEYQVMTMDMIHFKIVMKALKVVHLILYGCVIYLLLVVVPIYLLKLLKYFLSRFLLIVFFVFIVDALLKIQYDINIDLIKIFNFSTYVNNPYINSMLDTFKYIGRVMRIIEITNEQKKQCIQKTMKE